MGRRGVSAGGGQSSLGYLFGNAEAAPAAAPKNEPPVKNTTPSPTPAAQPAVDKPTQAPTPTIPIAAGSSTNNYYRADGQNCGNFITDRPSTKVHAAPGGNSSLNYLFGNGSKK